MRRISTDGQLGSWITELTQVRFSVPFLVSKEAKSSVDFVLKILEFLLFYKCIMLVKMCYDKGRFKQTACTHKIFTSF